MDILKGNIDFLYINVVKTFVYKLVELEENDKMILKFYQQRYSTAFRKLYNNFELSQDKNYLTNDLSLPSTKWTEYLVKEVGGLILINHCNDFGFTMT
jgi:hypothetical protein